MKLHLPKGLKAALLATFTVLAASWSHQGYAAELTKVITMSQMAQEATITDGATLSTTWEMTDGVVYDFSGSGYLGGIANTDLLNALKGDDYVTVAAWINPSSHAAGTGGGDGGSLFGYGAQGDGIKVIDRLGALKATTKNVADFTTSAVGIDLNTWQLVAVTMHRNNGKLDVYYMLDGVYSSVVTGGAPNAASTDSFAIGSGNSESPRELYQGSIGNMIVFTSAEMVTVTDVTSQMGAAPTKIPGLELIWNGPAPTAAWDFTSTNWLKAGSPSTFESGTGITVIFGSGTMAKTVTINETIDAGDVVVSDNYTFTMGDDPTLMMNSLSLDADKTLALGGTGTVMAGGLTYGSGSALNITGNIAMRSTAFTSGTTASLHVLSGGVLTIGTDATVDGQGFVGTDGSSEQGGTQAFSKLFRGEVVDVQTGGKLVMDGNMNFNDSSVSGVGHQTSGVADMEITGSVQINTYGSGNTWALGNHKLKVGGDLWLTNKQYLDIAGGSTEVVGTLALAHEGNNAAGRYRASVTATENSTLTLRDIKFYAGRNEVNVDGSTLTFTQESGLLIQDGSDTPTAEADLNTVNFNNATLLAQTNSWELAPLDSATVNTSGTATLDVGEGQGMTLTFTSVDGSFTKKGAGTATVSGTGYLNDTIVVKAGELVLGGTYGIDNNTSGMDISYSGAEHAGNGFRTTKGSITVYTTEGTAKFSGDAEFTYAGEAVTLTEGKYQAPEKTDNTTFYVNTDAESVSKATARPEMEHIVLAGNTTLNVDQDVASSVVSVASGTATVNILADKTVNGTMLGVTLTGAGTYALNEGTAVLGTGVMLGEGWTGAVRIGGFASGNDTHLNDLVNGDKSILEINGITGGHLPEWIDGTITANIRLTDKGDTAAWTWTNGTTGTTPVNLTFSGKWSGDGSFVKTGNYNQSFTFAGDIKDWVGSFVYASGNYTTNLTLKDNANEVNAFIEKTGNGTLNILVETDVTFNAAIDASKLVVSSGKTATLNTDENYTISGGLSGTGSLVKTGTGTVTIASPTGTGTSAAMLDITVSEGALEATAANALGSGPITVAAGATLKLANGGALGTSQAVTNNGNVTLGSTLTAGSITGGTLTLTPEFPVDSELKDVGDITTTGNGFSQGGVIHVYDTEHAMLTGITDIIHGDKHYSLATDVDENGDINASTPDWTTYQLKVDNDSQPTIQAIMDYADAKSGGTGTLQHIVVTGVGMSLVDDSTEFKTSMLGGDKLNSLMLALVNGASLKMDADLATSLQFGSNSGDAAAEIVLEKNAAIDGAIWAYTAAGGTADLTVKGAYTLSLSELDLTHGKVTLQDGAKVAVATIDPEGGDSIVLKDTAELSLANGSISIKAVDTAKDATLSTETGVTYDIGSADYTIENARITLSYSDAAHNFGHVVAGDVALVNAGSASVNDTNAANTAYAALHAQNGNIYLANKAAVTVADLTVDSDRTVGSQLGNNVAITVTDTAEFGSDAKLGAALTMAGGSTLDTANPVALQNHALSLASGVNIGDDLWSTLTALDPEASTNLFTGVSALTLAGAEYSADVDLKDIFNHTSLKANKYTLGYKDGNVVITKNLENNRYWKGGDGTWNTTATNLWTDEETGGSDAPFVNGYNAHFTGATNGTVTLGENITAESITVSGADYIFSPGTYSLTVNKSVEADARKATFNMALSGENLKLTAKNGGTIILNNGGSVKDVEVGAGSTVSATASLTVTDGFTNAGQVNVNTLTLQKGTEAGGNVTANTTLNLTAGQSYTFGNLKVGTLSGASANLTIGGANTLTVDANSTVAGLTLGDDATVAGDGTLNTGGVSLLGDATVSGKLSTGTLAGTGTLKIEGGELSAAVLGSGVGLATTGNTTITSTALRIALNGTVDNAATGAVTFVGSFDVGNCTTVDGTATYVGGGISDNGFKQAQKIVSVISAGTAVDDNAKLYYKGTEIGKMDDNGQVTFQGATDYTTFYVNKSGSTEKVSTALSGFDPAPGAYVLANGTTLQVDGNNSVAMSQITLASGAAANLLIDRGSTVTTDGTAKNLTLMGAGTLAVDAGKATTGVTLANTGWTGTVSFTEAQLTTLDGAWNNRSTVSLTGVTGSLGGTAVGAAVVLNKGTGDWGFGQTAGGTQSVTLNGAITGEGNLGVKGGSSTSTFTLGGNIDGWTGNFVAGSANATLKLTGTDKDVNGSVNGSNLALVVETNATLKSDSSVARVDASSGSLKVDDGKTLTVTDSIIPDNIKLGAGASIVAAFMGGTEYGYQDGTIANGTDSDQNVTIDNANITVTGATLATGGATAFTVDNKLVDAKLLVAETLTKAVALNNVQDSLQVEDGLDIGTGGSLKVANGAAKQTLDIGSGTLTLADGTTLDADVAIGSGATVKLNYNMGGTPVATTLNGGALTLGTDLTLSGNLYNKMATFTALDDNTVLDLFQGVGALTLDGSAYSGEVNAAKYFDLRDLSDLGDFTLLYNYSSEVVSIRFNITQARTLTWNGTEGDSSWEVGEGTAENWLDPTQEQTHFNAGDTAKFTADADYKDVTIDAVSTETRDITVTGAEAQYGFVVDSGTSTLDVTNLMRVTEGAALAKKGEGDLVLNLNAALAVDGSTLAVEEGSLYIGGVSAKLDLKNATVKIAEDGTLVAGTITGDAATTIAVDGLLQVSGGSIQSLTAGVDSTLSIAGGTLAIATDTTLYGLVNTGTLDLGTHDLTLADSTGEGGNVTAGTLHLAETGSSFGDLKVNTIHYAYDKEGAGALDYVEVDTITSNGADKVTLDMTDVRGNGGSLAPIQRTSPEITYMLVYANGQTLDAASFMLDAATQEALVQNGLIREGAGLTVSEDSASLLLTIGGQDLTWYTSSDTTEWGYKVMNGDAIAHGGNTLNGVQHVVVDESRIVDVTGVAVDELLRVRNITGTADQTITFTGGRSNTVALIATEDTSSDVNVAAEHILLGIGLPETDDIDPTAYDADLHVGSVKLTDAAMVVTNGATFSVDRLNGDDDSVVSGAVVIEGQGGAYRGGYAGADITVAEDAEATLYAGESLRLHGEGMVKLMYTKSTEIDGVDADGMTLVLNNPNASIIGSTLTMQDESGLTNGTLVFGMSAVESAKHIGSIQAPQVIEGSLVLGDGTTVVVNQDELADSGIAMVVNNGGAYRNLALAYIGNDETDTKSVLLNGYLYGKYYKNARIEDGELLVDMRDDFYQDLAKATTPNGRAGAGMLDDALRELNPQAYDDTWSGDLATVMTALETGAIPQGSADRVAAAMSGASAAAMGAAWSHDVDRQLRAIRNRTTSMGVANCEVNEDMPYFNAWVNAEGDYSKLSADGTLAGYKLSSWGGTLGFDVDFTPGLTAGVALTVMQGDFTAESAEAAQGDLDRLYVTVFGRYTHRAWTHTLVATFGTADTKLKRTVNYGVGSYDANGDSDGRAFGVMYEAGYAKALDEDGSTCIQPMVNLSYRSTSLGGYTEKGGSDAALKVGEAKANVFTAALGARLQSTIGTSVYNRASIFEGRVLVKGDAGDRDVAVNNAFTGVHATRKVKSAELGAFGVEVGAGVIIPLGESAGSLFLDATGEFRNKYTEINGTVGYRFNF